VVDCSGRERAILDNKKVIFDTIYDKQSRQPPPLLFVRNIGNSILEILVVKGLEKKVIGILFQWGFKEEKVDPVANLMMKSKDQNVVKNAEKCKEKAQAIISKFSGPEVINYYKNLNTRADAIIAAAGAKTPAAANAANNINDNDNNREGPQNSTPKEKETGAALPAAANSDVGNNTLAPAVEQSGTIGDTVIPPPRVTEDVDMRVDDSPEIEDLLKDPMLVDVPPTS